MPLQRCLLQFHNAESRAQEAMHHNLSRTAIYRIISSEKLILAYQNRRNLMMEASKTHSIPLGIEVSKVSLSKDYMVGGYVI